MRGFFLSMTKQSIAIMLLSNAQANSSRTALHYARAALQQNYTINCVFLYHDAVQLASTYPICPQDEQNIAAEWQALIVQHQLPAVACIASALKRGVINSTEAKRHGKDANNLHPAIELAGLGTWLEALTECHQHIVFAE